LNGIKADRLNSTGFGETKPIDTNKTAAGNTNRRAEISLIKNKFSKIFMENAWAFFLFEMINISFR
jgi:hypothetical protein